MGKASSSKKVARAARAGGATNTSRRKLAFPLAIFAIVVVGVGLVVFARGESGLSSASAEAPSSADHWHAAYGFYVCDTFLPPLSDANPDTTGIHTHADGVIHIHPFSDRHGGKNATLGKWGDIVDVDFGSDSITLPDGRELKSGDDCNGQPANLVIYEWPADDLAAEPRIFESDFGSVRLDRDRAAITIALVPEGTEVPRPDSVPTLDNLSDMGPQQGPQQAPGGAPPSVPVDPSSGSDPAGEGSVGDVAPDSVPDPASTVPDASTP
jgi:hypothetical protein